MIKWETFMTSTLNKYMNVKIELYFKLEQKTGINTKMIYSTVNAQKFIH